MFIENNLNSTNKGYLSPRAYNTDLVIAKARHFDKQKLREGDEQELCLCKQEATTKKKEDVFKHFTIYKLLLNDQKIPEFRSNFKTRVYNG